MRRWLLALGLLCGLGLWQCRPVGDAPAVVVRVPMPTALPSVVAVATAGPAASARVVPSAPPRPTTTRVAVAALPSPTRMLASATPTAGVARSVASPTLALPSPTPTVASPTLALPSSTPVVVTPTLVVLERQGVEQSVASPTPLSPTPIEVAPTATLTVLDRQGRERIFDNVWQTVADHYLYRDFRGVNWDASRGVYRPQAVAAASPEAFYAVIGAMINDLRDQHSRFVSPQDATEEAAIADGSDAYVGIGLVTERNGEQTLITTVFAGSPAAESGIRRRDRLLALEGVPYGEGPYELRGPAGSTVMLRVQAPGEAPRDVQVTRRAVVAQYLPEAYLLPATNVGYLLVQSLWAERMAKDARAALATLIQDRTLDGLILDLRGNSGGWRSVLEGMLAHWVSGYVGDFSSTDDDYPLLITANSLFPSVHRTPLVVLVDRNTESYAEVLAAVLQQQAGAQVVGEQTAGNTETVYAYDFEDGSRLWIAQEGFTLPNDIDLEGRGVIPDMVVNAPWLLYPEADDPYIRQALVLLAAR